MYPFSLVQCLVSYFSDKTTSSSPNVLHRETLDYKSFEEVEKFYQDQNKEKLIGKYKSNLCVGRLHIYIGQFFHPRIYTFGASMYYDEKDKIFIEISKVYFDDKPTSISGLVDENMVIKRGNAPVKTKAYRMFDYLINIFKIIDEKKVSFTQVHLFDLGAWGSSEILQKAVAKKRGDDLRKIIIQIASELPDTVSLEDFKDEFFKMENGKVVNGLGQLLYDSCKNKIK
jgi:hypothetical protein